MATYFTVFPNEAETFYEEAMNYQEEEERRQEELNDKVIKYVCKMKKQIYVNLFLNCSLTARNGNTIDLSESMEWMICEICVLFV